MRLLVAGADGQLGRELVRRGRARGCAVTACDRAGLDLCDAAAPARALRDAAPEVVINAAAYTAVDRAEHEPELAYAVNRDGVAALAAACAAMAGRGAVLLHVSTDYVFDGRAARPYRPDDPVAPLGVYGASKLAGERALRAAWPRHAIVRTSWVFGADGANFVKTMLRLGAERERLAVVDDQLGRPTWAGSLADALLTLARALFSSDSGYGTYHYADAPQTTWHGFAAALFALAGPGRVPALKRLDPIPTSAYPTPAARPAYSVLDGSLLERRFGVVARPWRYGLRQTLAALDG